MEEDLKLYVWEDVLEDYMSGIMFAYARDVDHARILIIKRMGGEEEDLKIEPREIKDPEGFYVYGSA